MNTPTSPKKLASPKKYMRQKRAHGRSLSDFIPLRPAEKKLLDCCVTGEEAKVGDAVPFDDPDPKTIVRADFLRFLLLGGDEQAPVHEKGVQLHGAQIEGALEFQNCFVPHGMRLSMCLINEEMIARNAHIAGPLDLSGSHLRQGLNADGLRCDSAVFLQFGFCAFGEVRFMGAQLGGSLECAGGQFEPEGQHAISADQVIVRGNINFVFPFKATGEVRLLSAEVGGSVRCSGGQFHSKNSATIVADRAVIAGSFFLNKEFKATGTVELLRTRIGCDLVCSGGHFEPIAGEAISADGIVVVGAVFLNEGFKSTGLVRLLHAEIGGNLECIDGQFVPQKGGALTADGIAVEGDVFFSGGFKATGAVRLLGAQIAGNLECQQGGFFAPDGVALNLRAINVRDTLFLRGLGAPARISAASAQIGQLVDDWSAWSKGTILDGLVYQSLADTAATDAATRIEWLKKQSAKDLGEDTLKRNFRPQPWKQLQKVLREMGHDADAREVGVAYEDQLRKADRIGQIIGVKNGNRWIPFLRRRFLRALHWLFGFLAGYGYHPLRLFMSLVWVWLFCGVIYWWLAYAPHSAIGPTDPLVFQNSAYQACTTENNGNWMLCKQLPAEYTTFSPLAYSLDVLLPLVDLGQEKRWGPLVPTPASHFCIELLSLSPPHWLRLLNWFQILYGWMASLLFVAIVSGMSRRSEMDK